MEQQWRRITKIALAPVGTKGWVLTLECGHDRHSASYPVGSTEVRCGTCERKFSRPALK